MVKTIPYKKGLNMKILIDGDGCPVVRQSIEIAKEYNIEAVILCDTSHRIEADGVKTITVSKGTDSVDFVLVNMINKGDIAVTQDYGLAAMCLAKGAVPIHQNGFVYSSDNIDGLLFARHESKKARRANKHIKGPAKRTAEQDEKFCEVLRETIEKVVSSRE